MSRIQKYGDCWLWTGARTGGRKGQPPYGFVRLDAKRRTGAHRFMYELLVGPIPEGLKLDHLCRTPLCVNPDHLEPVTQRENVRRGDRHPGERDGMAKLTDEQVAEIRRRYDQGDVRKEIARDFGISPIYVSQLGQRLWRKYPTTPPMPSGAGIGASAT